MTHTPGPWRWDDLRDDGKYAGLLLGPNEACVLVGLSAQGEGYIGIESVANARLIAAAPEMLDALQKFVGSMTFPDDPKDGFPIYGLFSTWRQARAAIAKATGS